MKIIVYLFSILVVFGLIACDKKADSSWAAKEIILDGNASDWTSYRLQHFDKKKITLGLCNDENYLYILVVFKDRSLNRMFRMNGLNLWIDEEGKKDRTFGIRYVGPYNPDFIRGDAKGVAPEKMEQIQERMRDIKRGMTLIVNGLEISPLNGRVPEVVFNSSYGNHCLEYRIPLQNGSDELYAIDISSVEEILLGFEMSPPEGMNQTRAQSRPGVGVGGRGGVGGGGGKGGMRGGTGGTGGRGGQSGSRRGTKNMEKQEIWIKLMLANQSGK